MATMPEIPGSYDISRRKVLQSAGFGFASGGISTASASGDKTSITLMIKSNGEKVYEEVPEEWYEHEKSVKKSLQKAQKQYHANPYIKSISPKFTNKKIAGRKISELIVHTYRETDLLEQGVSVQGTKYPEIPNAVSGVPIKESHASIDWADDGCFNDGSYSKVKGGIEIDPGYGTSGCIVSYEGSGRLATCAHLWDCDIKHGDEVYVDGQAVGEIYEYDAAMDWAFLEINSGWLPGGNVLDHPYKDDVVIDGHYTEIGLHSLASQNKTIFKIGSSTGLQTGSLSNLDYDTSYGDFDCGELNGMITTEINTAGGDSGGPVYAKYGTSNAGMVGIHSGHRSGFETGTEVCGNMEFTRSIEVPAYYIHNNTGANFGYSGEIDA